MSSTPNDRKEYDFARNIIEKSLISKLKTRCSIKYPGYGIEVEQSTDLEDKRYGFDAKLKIIDESEEVEKTKEYTIDAKHISENTLKKWSDGMAKNYSVNRSSMKRTHLDYYAFAKYDLVNNHYEFADQFYIVPAKIVHEANFEEKSAEGKNGKIRYYYLIPLEFIEKHSQII